MMEIKNYTGETILLLKKDSRGKAGFTAKDPHRVPYDAREMLFSIADALMPEQWVALAEQQEIVDYVSIGEYQVPVISVLFGEPYLVNRNGVEEPRLKFPARYDNVLLIVSRLVAEAAKASGRTTDDILVVSDPVWDGTAKVIGFLNLSTSVSLSGGLFTEHWLRGRKYA